jgi:hypothetical protein
MVHDCLQDRDHLQYVPRAAGLKFPAIDLNPGREKVMTTGLVAHADLPTDFRFSIAYGTQKDAVAVYDDLELVLIPVSE